MSRMFWIATAVIAAAPATAAPVDDQAAMICTIAEAFDCDVRGDCLRTSLRDLNAPAFLEVDPGNRRVSGERPDGSVVETAIERLNRDGEQVILQGDEAGRGWTVTIAPGTGRMTLTIADVDYALIGFGACRNEK